MKKNIVLIGIHFLLLFVIEVYAPPLHMYAPPCPYAPTHPCVPHYMYVPKFPFPNHSKFFTTLLPSTCAHSPPSYMSSHYCPYAPLSTTCVRPFYLCPPPIHARLLVRPPPPCTLTRARLHARTCLLVHPPPPHSCTPTLPTHVHLYTPPLSTLHLYVP
jgi:hypothetical protein